MKDAKDLQHPVYNTHPVLLCDHVSHEYTNDPLLWNANFEGVILLRSYVFILYLIF
jgi:hypothetical protein